MDPRGGSGAELAAGVLEFRELDGDLCCLFMITAMTVERVYLNKMGYMR